jgi:predicted molibdopterin-dependent oxidoreductase YjgC
MVFPQFHIDEINRQEQRDLTRGPMRNIGTAYEPIDPAILALKVRALSTMGEDPIMTDPGINVIRCCLEACEFLLLQEIFPSQTAPFAAVLLPGTSWAEKSGTFTDTERCIQLVGQAIAPVREARPGGQDPRR